MKFKLEYLTVEDALNAPHETLALSALLHTALARTDDTCMASDTEQAAHSLMADLCQQAAELAGDMYESVPMGAPLVAFDRSLNARRKEVGRSVSRLDAENERERAE